MRHIPVFLIIVVSIAVVPANGQYVGEISKSGSTFEMKPQQTAKFPAENLTITFLDILEDSRCPSDVTCIWAGQTRLSFALSNDKKTEIVMGSNDSEYVFGEYKIQMVEVRPYPKTTMKINHDDYTAVLKISKGSITNIPSPLKQTISGVEPESVSCRPGLELALKYDRSPACVSHETHIKLYERGWTKLVPIIPDIGKTGTYHINEKEKTFDIKYSITDGDVKEMAFDPSSNSLIVTVKPTDDGSMTIGIPRDLLDAKMDYCPPIRENPPDDDFFALLDGEEIPYDEVSTTSETRTLKMHFMPDSSRIEIIGTCLI
jgi:hypothetical protein